MPAGVSAHKGSVCPKPPHKRRLYLEVVDVGAGDLDGAQKPWINVFDFLQVFNILDQNSPEGPRGKTTAVGTGAFSMVEWLQGDHVTYAKNKNYWRTGKPLLDQIVLNIAKDQQAMAVQLEAGQVDFIVNPTIQDFVRLSDDTTRYQGLELPNPAAFAMMQPNSTRPPMDNKLVRQALN